MIFAQYCRIEAKAGGVGCSDREFIRAALSKIHKCYRYDRAIREPRHKWLRDGLAIKRKAAGLIS